MKVLDFIFESQVEPASVAQDLWSFPSAREVVGSNLTFRCAPQES